ncbi:hypothetical protein BC827DRAFT_1202454 [Russula dissimulans]|nr:hypothetical protein BC827DRAFT_1202454 [Russula dissimulans]
MSYNHYRYAPGWGTQQFQLGAPPQPSYQPLPTWTGQDFYSAHAMGYDPYVYQNTMSRLSSGGGGFGRHEAKSWHRRAYAGLGEITRMMPQEIGAAAAYEAYRQVKYGTNAYEFLYGDYELQRDALTGLAIAEAVRLWQDTGRPIVDQYALQMACDSAAATASNIVAERELDGGYGSGFGMGSHRHRRNSFAYGTPSYAGSVGYAGSGYAGSGYAGSGYAGSGYAGSGYAGSGYAGSNMGGSPLLVPGNIPSSPIAGVPMPIPGSSYSSYPNTVGIGMPMSYSGYAGSYGTPGYDYLGLQAANMGGYASLPGTPATILLPPEDQYRRRSSRHRRRRHRSHDRY